MHDTRQKAKAYLSVCNEYANVYPNNQKKREKQNREKLMLSSDFLLAENTTTPIDKENNAPSKTGIE